MGINLLKIGLILPIYFAANHVEAQNFSPTAPALGFNVFTKTGVTFTAGDSHGAVATGGNLTLNGNTIIAMQNAGAYPNGAGNSSNYGLVINGGINFQSGNVSYVNQGDMRIGNLTGIMLHDHDNNNASTNLQATYGPFNSNPRVQLQHYQSASTVNNPNGIGFTQAFNSFAEYSAILNEYGVDPYYNSYINVITIPSGMNPHITLVDNKINVIRLTASGLTNLYNQGSFIFDNQPTANRLLIFNIDAPGTYNWSPPNIGGIGESVSAYMLWNWVGTTQLNIVGGNSTYGTLLAPGTNINKTGGNNTNGQVIANDLIIAYGEIHDFPFQGAGGGGGNSPQFPRKPSPLALTSLELSGMVTSQGQPHIRWTAQGVEGVNHYQIQRSENGVDFRTVTIKTSAGTIAEESFSYVDAGATEGQYLYRISAVNDDGTADYSNTLAINTRAHGQAGLDVTVVGNPVAAYHLQISAPMTTDLRVDVLAANGTKALPTQTVQAAAGASKIALDGVRSLPNGLYLVNVHTADGSYRKSMRLVH